MLQSTALLDDDWQNSLGIRSKGGVPAADEAIGGVIPKVYFQSAVSADVISSPHVYLTSRDFPPKGSRNQCTMTNRSVVAELVKVR